MNNHDTIESQLKVFITRDLLFDESRELAEDDELLLDGIIDSLGAIRLVGFVESTWNVSIPPQDVTVENFGTVGQIASYVRGLSAEDTPSSSTGEASPS